MRGEAVRDPKPISGLIRYVSSSPLPPPHHCSPPGAFLRWLYRFFRMPIAVDSLWRCADCGSVYCFHRNSWDAATGNFVSNERWLKETNPQLWVDRGGRL